MTPSCSARQASPGHVLLDIESSISKFDPRSGQGQVMIQVGQCAYLSKYLDEPSLLTHWRIFTFIMSRVIGEKPIVNSCDFR